MAGPWPVLTKEGYSYRVQLPVSMKINPVFPAESLRRDPDNLLPGQANTPLLLIKVTANDEYKVQEVIAVKLVRGKLVYRAKWTGTDDDPEYYPVSDFKYSPYLLHTFHLTNPILPGPLINLQLWLRAWEDGTDDYDYLDNNKPALACSRSSFFQRGG
jgi:hypothetical protein